MNEVREGYRVPRWDGRLGKEESSEERLNEERGEPCGFGGRTFQAEGG